MQIYNSRNLDNNQRFAAAIAAGLVSAVACGIAYGLLMRAIHIESSVFYVLIGWAIGYVIRKVGRGVHTRFGVLGACCVFLAILIGDICAMFGVPAFFMMLRDPTLYGYALQSWAVIHLSTNFSALLGLILRAAGIYFGFYNSMVL